MAEPSELGGAWAASSDRQASEGQRPETSFHEFCEGLAKATESPKPGLIGGLETYTRAEHTSERNTSRHRFDHSSSAPHTSTAIIMAATTTESRVILAIKALEQDQKLSIRATAKLYDIPHTTLAYRCNGRSSRSNSIPKSRNLTQLEENVIVQYILELCARSFHPRLGSVEDMANQLLSTRAGDSTRRVGKNWAANFVKRRPELQTRLSRKYDYQRAKCEDPDLIQKWFQLIQAIKAKYGIADNDIYNFDETGFAMGIISTTTVVTGAEMRDKAKLAQPGNREWATVIQGIGAEGWAVPPFIVLAGQHHLASWYTETNLPNDWAITLSDNGWTTNEVAVEWLKHFNQFTARRCISDYRLLVLDGHKSHHSAAFELYCQEHKIITVCMPPHSSHLLQPLDIGCFGPLKQAYSRQVEDLMRAHVNHISKLEFLSGFHRAFTAAITPKNIRSSFAGAGIVPYDPDRVLLKLDVQLPASTPINSRPSTANAATTWTTKTPMNPSEAGLQSELIKNQIIQHQDSSPTSLLAAVDQFTKGTQTIMHQLALIRAENTTLRTANEVLSKRRQAKRRRIQHGGTLTIHQAGEILDDNAVGRVSKPSEQPPARGYLWKDNSLQRLW
ncbi:NADPH oxidase [Drechslerella dactyloides]|uniref:NADPH oxidase n=1 Tax=Drechslerella dactyloides TaxID=74499 RepID=A0AAD6ISX8_DREDA|nr:NADPH oxidase [Drechslerella dactyloides]